MDEQKEELLTPYTLAERNEILVKFANYSFTEALSQVNDQLSSEKDLERRLGLLAAKSWIIRKKLYVALHDPYISALSEIEDTDIFDGLDEEDYNDFDSLFEDSAAEKKLEITMLKAATVDGQKLPKDTILELEETAAKKLIDEGKASLTTN